MPAMHIMLVNFEFNYTQVSMLRPLLDCCLIGLQRFIGASTL